MFDATLGIGGAIAPMATRLHWWWEELQLPVTIKRSFL